MSTKIVIDLPSANKVIQSQGLGPGGRVQKFFTSEIQRIADPYVPYQDGFLKNSSSLLIDGTGIMYTTPYARRLWYGDDFNFQKNGQGLQGSRWVTRAWIDNKDAIIKATNRYIRKGA